MYKNFFKKDIPFILLSFFIPLICFLYTSSHSLMFDDAAEFALVIKLGSIAHPPGTPSYILFGFLWTKLTALFSLNITDSLTLFSSLCISFSSLLLYMTFKTISLKLPVKEDLKSKLICCICSIGFATASTTWSWANTVEVYSFQVLALSITLFGLINYHFNRNNISIIVPAAGISLGLGNHHLTMVLFLPFVPLFFLNNVFIYSTKSDKKKKIKNENNSFLKQLFSIFKMQKFWLLIGLTLLMTFGFYCWMFLRAQHEYLFMFGQPKTLKEFIYHISGATYLENISSGSEQIVNLRIPYFLKLTTLQLFIFIPFFIAGIVIILKKKLFPLFTIIILYFLFIFFYQLNNNQWGSTDAYLLLPFMVLYFGAFYGAIYYSNNIKIQFILPILLIFQIYYNFTPNNRKSYPVSDSLMKLLDISAPKNSIIIISDWTLIIQYYFYRITENFRPDLIVLNNDIKFEHYKMLPLLYPDFYNQIKFEYDSFINELMKEHPHQVIGTGCDLTTLILEKKYKLLVNKIEEVANLNNVYFLTDPKAHYSFSTANIYSSSRYISGCFSSSMPGDSKANEYFLKLDFDFLKSPLLLKDPAALDKIVDFQTMLDRYMDFYKANNDIDKIQETQNAQNTIFKLQRKMKKNMPFGFVSK